MIEINIDGKKVKGRKGQTVLEVARKNGIDIASLCFRPDLKPKASCRLCLVEIKGWKGMQTSCNTEIEEGMEIKTDSPKIRKGRRINLELLFSQHREECNDCVWDHNCYLLQIAKKYNIKINKYYDRKSQYPVYNFGPSLIFDSSKCIDCRNCIEACKVGFLETKEKGHLFKVLPSKSKECIYCGQCIVHCPAGAFEGREEFENIFKKNNRPVFFQIAPSIRASIGNYSIEKIAAALKKIGADKVFDVCTGADITTIEEVKELLQGKKRPLLTSCCPAWVRFVEVYRPDLIPNLTSVRSPHMISGGLIKKYFSSENPFLVSIMPCVAKKYEITRKEMGSPVDYVITTRELLRLIEKIGLKKIKPEKLDNPFGEPSGAGVIYGASGGVAESALRTAFPKAKAESFRKAKGIKEIVISGKIKVAVVHGIDNFKKINVNDYDYIEVMACPGGCIGGGGQPMPVDDKIRATRAKKLYNIDKKKKVRLAHKNPEVKKIYKEVLKNKKAVNRFCHTYYGLD